MNAAFRLLDRGVPVQPHSLGFRRRSTREEPGCGCRFWPDRLLAAGALALLAAASRAPPSPPPPTTPSISAARTCSTEPACWAATPRAVREAIDRLYEERGTQLFVVYVDEFTGTSSDQDWANETAITSGLGDRDILLAIATDERIYSVSVADAFPLSDDQLADVAGDTLIPALRDDDWAGGAVAYADGLSGALAPSPVPLVIGGVAVAGVGTAVIAGAVRRRRAKKKVLDAAAADIKTLELRAGKLLVGLDDALKTSEQELGFAQAQFGDDQIRDFRAALADAKATAKQAFEIQHKLDDAFPETPEQYRAMTLQLIELAERADADARRTGRLVREAAPARSRTPRRCSTRSPEEQDGLAARIETAENILTGLAAQYPKADLDHLTGVPAQARKLTGLRGDRRREGPGRAGQAQGRCRRRGAGRAAGRRPGRPADRRRRHGGQGPRGAVPAAQAGTPPSSTSSCSARARRCPPLRTTSRRIAAPSARPRAPASPRPTGTWRPRCRSPRAIRRSTG